MFINLIYFICIYLFPPSWAPSAARLISASRIGDVKSDGQVVLRKNCVLKGDISYRKLHIEDGAQFEGQCDLVADMNLESVNN